MTLRSYLQQPSPRDLETAPLAVKEKIRSYTVGANVIAYISVGFAVGCVAVVAALSGASTLTFAAAALAPLVAVPFVLFSRRVRKRDQRLFTHGLVVQGVVASRDDRSLGPFQDRPDGLRAHDISVDYEGAGSAFRSQLTVVQTWFDEHARRPFDPGDTIWVLLHPEAPGLHVFLLGDEEIVPVQNPMRRVES